MIYLLSNSLKRKKRKDNDELAKSFLLTQRAVSLEKKRTVEIKKHPSFPDRISIVVVSLDNRSAAGRQH